MTKRSGRNKPVRMSAGEIPAPTPKDLLRLRRAMAIPGRSGEEDENKNIGPRVRRNAGGKIVKHPLDPFRCKILESLDRLDMTRYELWKKARVHCRTLSASAVYEYLRGARDIEARYVAAILKAARLKIVAAGKRPSAR